MLSKEKNRQLTEVGPGTPMGELMRRYWLPVAGASELDRKATRPVRLLGEDLVLYKDLRGTYGLVERHCPHRRADLTFGIVEQCGIRCSYHGWLFDETGACREQPYEDLAVPEIRMREKIRAKAYLVQEKAGILWAYLGPQPAPQLPNWEPFTWKNGFVQITISEVPCNWFQAQENSIDPVHFEWQHDNFSQRMRGDQGTYGPRHTKVDFEEFEFGFVYKRVMEGRNEDHPDWTVGRVCLWPNCLFVGNHFQWRVPIDDTNTLSVTWTYLHVPKEREPFAQNSIPTWYGPLKDESGNWIDSHVTNQDIIAWIGQGVIADRTLEHLGPSDKGIIMMRRRFFEEMDAVRNGKAPKGLIWDPAQNEVVELPILNKAEHVQGLTTAEIDSNPVMEMKLKRFVLQAGQPDSVREAYEEATGLKMLDEAALPGRFHR